MINHIEGKIIGLCGHRMHHQDDDVNISYTKAPIPIEPSSDLEHSLLSFFFDKYKHPLYFNFASDGDNLEENVIYSYASEIFDNPDAILECSKKITKYLHQNSKHPNIKAGDVLVSYVQDVLIDDEMLDALCIYKIENRQTFLSLDMDQDTYRLGLLRGVNMDKMDKGCIIFNTEREQGYKICTIDRSNSGVEAQFWMKNFLNATHRSDTYHHTKNMIEATKSFIDERVKPVYEIDRTHEADMLNKSKVYLNHVEDFDSETYAKEIFQDDRIASDFKQYKKEFQEEKNLMLADDFSVNQRAVKNYANVFRSVIKLDKNFHVYVHGDRNQITRGVDDQGRKFYTLYYENES